MKALADLDPMPFGKHKGKLMQEVPAPYLHYLWTAPDFDADSPVGRYIRENLGALSQEHPDGLWKPRTRGS